MFSQTFCAQLTKSHCTTLQNAKSRTLELSVIIDQGRSVLQDFSFFFSCFLKEPESTLACDL